MAVTSRIVDRVAVYPSAELPAVPGFVFTIPEGWMLDEQPDALGVVRTIETVDDFWINAILTTDRVRANLTLKDVAAATKARLLAQIPDADVHTERIGTIGDREIYFRGVALTVPKTDRKLGQMHSLFFAPPNGDDRLRDVFQVVGTAPLHLIEKYGPKFVEIVTSFRFT